MKKNNIFWGMVLILMAALAVFSGMGLIEGVGFWKILFTVAFAALLISGIVKLSMTQVLFSIAFLAIVWDDVLGIQSITPWTVLFAALLGSIGFKMIFGSRKRFNRKAHIEFDDGNSHGGRSDYGETVIEEDDGSEINCKTTFGSIVKYAGSDNLKRANISATFGSVTLYLENAKVPSGKVFVNIDATFGGVEIYVPKNWNVINDVDVVLGGLDIKGMKTGEDEVDVVLVGNSRFSGIEIKYN